MTAFERRIDQSGITLHIPEEKGLFRRLLGGAQTNLETMTKDDRSLAFAIADLRALADELSEPLEIEPDHLHLSHRLAAGVDAKAGELLGLYPLTDLTLHTDVEGIVGDPNFQLKASWFRGGIRKVPKRTGAFLETDRGPQRLPLWMYEALNVYDAEIEQGDASHWEALARFRRALDPGVTEGGDSTAARISMSDFLSGLKVSLADSFSLSPNAAGDDFEVLPFARDTLDEDDEPSEAMSELEGNALAAFQRKVRQFGPLKAYRLDTGGYVVIDRSAAPALEVMAKMQRAPRDQRAIFIRNPGQKISEAVEASLAASGALEGMDDAAKEETIDKAAGKLFVETAEYTNFSARVTGVGIYEAPAIASSEGSATTWLPEIFSAETREKISLLPSADLTDLADAVETALETGQDSVSIAGVHVQVSKEVHSALKAEVRRRLEDDTSEAEAKDKPTEADQNTGEITGPAVLVTQDNYDDVHWRPDLKPRNRSVDRSLPSSIRTALRDHQIESFHWQLDAWQAGLPGILNADEQGLGKTLQTIAFLVWLNGRMDAQETPRSPILIVAPTSLLENWEQEVSQHVEAPGLGRLIRLYGSGTSHRRMAGTAGKDVDTGEALLDFEDLENAAKLGNGHMTWILTTYTTLANYQHSLAQIPFAAAVFDEIQALKTPGSMRACAARAMKADFRIGLTGTPIENATSDLWAIMDQLAPGSLGSLREFRAAYAVPREDNMLRLYTRVFESGGLPPLALRRLKENVAADLPKKTRSLLPFEMPEQQAEEYDYARSKLATGKKGAALKMLHHIRSVSVHPDLTSSLSDEDFIRLSARLKATFQILKEIQAKAERALVFIEHRQMQYRFIELAKAAFGLEHVALINGTTPIKQRQAIVNKFQKHLVDDGGFDMLVLGPRAAGTGLTLTAATHVIHLSRWWNPAVEEQCNDRVHRIGQMRPVHVHVPMAIHPTYRADSFDCLLHSLMQRKRHLAGSALWPMGDTAEDAALLQESLARVRGSNGSGDPVEASVTAMFQRDQLPVPDKATDGSYIYE